jgi:hypothetical protein
MFSPVVLVSMLPSGDCVRVASGEVWDAVGALLETDV